MATLKMVTIDSGNARRDVRFWSQLLGWKIAHEQDDYGMLLGDSGIAIGFCTVADQRPPQWPNANGTKQFHFDLAVDDLDEAASACVDLGATIPEHQPGETWRVLLDPSGHPFCLTLASNWT